jgi:hypothetical protein
MTTSRGMVLRSKQGLNWLKPMFKELKGVIDRYVEWHDDPPEPPYWNNENASVSMLVAAGARADYVVLSDYRTDKTKGRKRINGRCDLLIGKGSRWLEIEAKPMYIGVDDKTNNTAGTQKITTVLQEAVHDAACLYPPKKNHHAGLVFATISINVPKNRNDQSTDWDVKAFKSTFDSVDADFCWMWYDPHADERYRWKPEKRLHPGVAIFLKTCNFEDRST